MLRAVRDPSPHCRRFGETAQSGAHGTARRLARVSIFPPEIAARLHFSRKHMNGLRFRGLWLLTLTLGCSSGGAAASAPASGGTSGEGGTGGTLQATGGASGLGGGPAVDADAPSQDAATTQPACDADFGLDGECASCLTQDCCDVAAQCQSTPSCVDLFQCLRACAPNDANCWIQCLQAYPSDAQAASAGIDGCFMQNCPSCELH
jgi:hypothetical protein